MIENIWNIRIAAVEVYLSKIAGTEKQTAVLHGKLKQTEDGFVYLDVSNDVINGLFRLIPDEEAVQPPYRQSKYNSVGAHISVMKSDEIEEFEITKIKEIGDYFDFTIIGMSSVIPDWKGIKKLWMVEVDSPQLESLRRRYGLTPRLNGHHFHITVGVKR